MPFNTAMYQWCLENARTSSDSSLTEKMTDLADFVFAAGRNEKIDCDTLNDRISWLSSTFSDDTMANDIVALLTEYSKIHCSD